MSLLDQVHKLEQQVVDRLKELEHRLKEVEPLTREYEQLRKVAERLGAEVLARIREGRRRRDREAGEDVRPSPRSSWHRQTRRANAGEEAVRPSGGAHFGGETRGHVHAVSDPPPASARRAARAATGAKGKAAPSRSGKRAGQQTRGRRAAPARPGQRDDELLRLVGDNPGITVREIGERLGVDATGLYRVVKRLTEAGRVRKDGPRLYPVDSAAVPSPAPAGVDASEPPSNGPSQTPGASAPAASGSSPTPAGGSSSGAG